MEWLLLRVREVVDGVGFLGGRLGVLITLSFKCLLDFKRRCVGDIGCVSLELGEYKFESYWWKDSIII